MLPVVVRTLIVNVLFLSILAGGAGCGQAPVGGRPVANLKAAGLESAVTRYPIVLHHGLLGFDQILGYEYFYKIPELLRSHGVIVETTRVPPINTIARRAHVLAAEIDRILDLTKAAKINVIAHSMGGLDVRYLISSMGYGDRIASVTTLSTPHRGSPIADVLLPLVGRSHEGGLHPIRDAGAALLLGPSGLSGLAAAESATVSVDDGVAVDIPGVVSNLSTAFLTRFDQEQADDPRVYYQSWSAQAQAVDVWHANPADPLLAITYAFIHSVAGENDGLVSVESARHGFDHGVVPASHVNIINQIGGMVYQGFDYRDYYLAMVRELAGRGF